MITAEVYYITKSSIDISPCYYIFKSSIDPRLSFKIKDSYFEYTGRHQEIEYIHHNDNGQVSSYGVPFSDMVPLTVAIKKSKKEDSLLHEIEMLKKIRENEGYRHNIIHMFNSNIDPKNEFIMTELADSDLTDAFKENNTVKIQFLNDILKAIHFIHKLDFLHRDIKLQNCFITSKRNQPDRKQICILGDFGEALDISNLQLQDYPVKYQKIAGTPYYVSPELWNAFESTTYNTYSVYSDYYAFGILANFLMMFDSKDSYKNNLPYKRTNVEGGRNVSSLWTISADVQNGIRPNIVQNDVLTSIIHNLIQPTPTKRVLPNELPFIDVSVKLIACPYNCAEYSNKMLTPTNKLQKKTYSQINSVSPINRQQNNDASTTISPANSTQKTTRHNANPYQTRRHDI